jgi:hypothetical protein
MVGPRDKVWGAQLRQNALLKALHLSLRAFPFKIFEGFWSARAFTD